MQNVCADACLSWHGSKMFSSPNFARVLTWLRFLLSFVNYMEELCYGTIKTVIPGSSALFYRYCFTPLQIYNCLWWVKKLECQALENAQVFVILLDKRFFGNCWNFGKNRWRIFFNIWSIYFRSFWFLSYIWTTLFV